MIQHPENWHAHNLPPQKTSRQTQLFTPPSQFLLRTSQFSGRCGWPSKLEFSSSHFYIIKLINWGFPRLGYTLSDLQLNIFECGHVMSLYSFNLYSCENFTADSKVDEQMTLPYTNLSRKQSFQFVYLQSVPRTVLKNWLFDVERSFWLHSSQNIRWFSSFLGSQSIHLRHRRVSPYTSMKSMASLKKVRQITQQKTTWHMLNFKCLLWFPQSYPSSLDNIVGIGPIFSPTDGSMNGVLVAADGWKMEVTTIHRSQLLFARTCFFPGKIDGTT